MIIAGGARRRPHLPGTAPDSPSTALRAGPLDARDVDQILLPHLPYTYRDVRHLAEDWSSYVPYRVCSACGEVVRPGAATAANGAEGRVHLRCSLKPPMQGESAGAAVLAEEMWQRSARLHHTSLVLRCGCDRLRERCRSARSTHTCRW
jgi:hypothetical protein